MGKPNANFVHILSGKTFSGIKYTLKISVKDGRISKVEISDNANLHVKELAEYFSKAKTENVSDAINIIKLKMIIYNQFVSEQRL